MERHGKPLIYGALLAAALMFSGFVLIVAEEGEAFGAPAVTVDLHQEAVEADVEEGSPAELRLNGSVTVLVPWSPERQKVNFELAVWTEGLNWVFEPGILVFEKTGPETQYFDLLISVPTTYPGGEGMLEVGGTWRYSPGTMGGRVEGDNAVMMVAPIYGGRMGSPASVDIHSGETGEVSLGITNTGNVGTDYQVEMEGAELIENAGISLSIENGGRIELGHGKEASLALEMAGGDISDGKTFFLTLHLKDGVDEELYDSVTIPITTHSVEEPSDDDDEQPPAGGGEGERDEKVPAPSEEGEDDGPPSVDTDNGISGKLIGYVIAVLVLGAVASVGVVLYSKKS